MTIFNTLFNELPQLTENITAAFNPQLPREIFDEDLPMVRAEMDRYEQLLIDATVEARQFRDKLDRLAARSEVRT